MLKSKLTRIYLLRHVGVGHITITFRSDKSNTKCRLVARFIHAWESPSSVSGLKLGGSNSSGIETYYLSSC
jgi:hypothetical protein